MYSIAKWSIKHELIFYICQKCYCCYICFIFSFLLLFRFILVLELFKMVKTSIITNNFAIHSLQFGISVRLSIYRFCILYFVVVKLFWWAHVIAMLFLSIKLHLKLSIGKEKYLFKTDFSIFVSNLLLLQWIYIRYFDKTLYFHWSSWLKNEKHFKWYQNSFI